MARNSEPTRVVHSAGPPDLSDEQIIGLNGTIHFDGDTLTLWKKQGLKDYEIVIPAAGLASVELGIQQRNKRYPFRLHVYDGDTYVVEAKASQARAFLRLSYALAAAGVKVTEEPPPKQSGGSAWWVGIGI